MTYKNYINLLLISILLFACSKEDVEVKKDNDEDIEVPVRLTDILPLKEVFAEDFTFGCLLSYRHIGFPDDPHVSGQSSVIAPQGGNLIKFHMNSMSPGNNMKPMYTVDIAGSAAAYNNASAEEKDIINVRPIVRFGGDLIAQLNWAKRQGFTFRGHTLIWHAQTPATFFYEGYSTANARVAPEVMTERMDHYIKEVIRLLHEGWPGMVTAMDVVNEAISDSGGGIRSSDNEWFNVYGNASYIMKAFEITHKYKEQYGETQMKLYYNDYNTHSATKADGIVNLCKPIFEAGYLDGIGMQEHNSITRPTVQEWVASYNKFYPICTEMAITELDVRTGTANPTAEVLKQQANQYGALFKCFVERSHYSGRGKIINVSKDGLNDEFTFVTNESTSLWDANNEVKPAYHAVKDIGIYYNLLDQLITEAESYQETNFSAKDWSDFVQKLNAAKTVIAKDYSSSDSAADGLFNAYRILKVADQKLKKQKI